MRKVQQGFTLIELIMVIVIIGILASVALPKFFDLQSDARQAKLKAIEGSIRSANSIAHSAALVKNKTSNATGDTVQLEDKTVSLAYGYPDVPATCTTACASGNILGAAGIDPADTTLTLSSNGTTLTLQVTGATSLTSCQITFQHATGTTTPPVITPTYGGC